MKRTLFTTSMAITLALGLATVGCQKRPTGVVDIPSQPRTGPADTAMNPPLQPESPLLTIPSTTPPLTPLVDTQRANWTENPEIFKASTVYFDFDSATLKSGERSKAGSVADYLKGNAQVAVRVEGNCDERGTEEYNRSLGERRALAAREELIRLGIDAARVDTKSWGEDNPANDHSHDEGAWKQNRRDDFILLTPPQ